MLQKTNEMDQGNCVTFAAALNSLILFIKYTTIIIKRARAMLSRASYLTVFRKWQIQQREKTRKIAGMENP